MTSKARGLLWVACALMLAAGWIAALRSLPEIETRSGWIRTDPDGARYTVRKLAKEDLRYRILDNGFVRVLPYYMYRMEKEDADYLYIREYLVDEERKEEAAPKQAVAPPVQVAIANSDRLDFVAFDEGLPREGQWRNGFDLSDLDQDGHIDIVHGPPRKGGGGPRVFLGDGAGHWRVWNQVEYPQMAYDYGSIAVADFNGDSNLDLALGAHMLGLGVLLGDGLGKFRIGNIASEFEADSKNPFTTRAILALDWNRDGRPDLAALGEGPSRGVAGGSFGWVLYLNSGSGQWQRLAQDPGSPRAFGDDLAFGDVNGDGKPDLVTASHVMGNRSILHLNGASPETVALDLASANPLIYAVAVADFDEDKRDDIALGTMDLSGGARTNRIEVLSWRESGDWKGQSVYIGDANSVFYAMAAGDIDGDAHEDLAALDNNGAVRIFLGDGMGAFKSEQSPEIAPLGSGCRGYHARLVDLDRDGRAELIAAFASEISPLSGEAGCPGDGRLSAWKALLRPSSKTQGAQEPVG